jgi:cobalamin biosynthesis protein CobD/CbiB
MSALAGHRSRARGRPSRVPGRGLPSRVPSWCALGEAALVVRDALRADDLMWHAWLQLVQPRRGAPRRPLVAAAAIESVAENASDSVVRRCSPTSRSGCLARCSTVPATLDARIGYRGLRVPGARQRGSPTTR